jgi:hypothetical protein
MERNFPDGGQDSDDGQERKFQRWRTGQGIFRMLDRIGNYNLVETRKDLWDSDQNREF